MEKQKKCHLKKETIEKALHSLFETSLAHLQNEQFSQALDLLQKCEEQLEILAGKGVLIDSDLVLATLHNIALCYQRLKNFNECAAYLEACIYNVNSKLKSIKSVLDKKIATKIRKIRYLCLLYIQLSDCFTHLSNSELSLSNGEKSLKFAMLSIKLCLNYCSEFLLKKASNKNQILRNTMTNAAINNGFYNEARCLLQFVYLKMNGKKLNKPPTEQCKRIVLGVHTELDWVSKLDFTQIFEIKVLALNDLKANHSIKAELSKDFMLDKVCMSISAFFVVHRHLNKSKLSKTYLKRAISLSTALLPAVCPILVTLKKEFSERYQKKNTKQNASFRSRSAKNVTREEIKAINKKAKKNHLDVKVLPWVVRSERHPDLLKKPKKTNTQSEETLGSKLQMSLGCFEKTEPEPPLSEKSSESSSEVIPPQFCLFSSELYGDNYYEEPDKYEYMPLKCS